MDSHLYLAVVFAFVFGNGGAAADDPQWSFKPLADKVPPGSADSPWIANPVDGFDLEKLKDHGLMPQGKADRHSLIRRVSATLTGLPPSVEQIEDFLNNEGRET
mgnify:CR=1 FL=1